MRILENHKEIHSRLMQRKNPNVLWGSPFDNAWVGLVLLNHKSRDEITLREISEYLDRWSRSPDFLVEERNIGAAALYTAILTLLKDELKVEEMHAKIKERLLALDKKEKGKFSLFNSPEIFYVTVLGLSLSNAVKTDGEIRTTLSNYLMKEVENNWSNKAYRFALYSGSAFELGIVPNVGEKIIEFLSAVQLNKLHIDEIIPLMWFATKYNEALNSLVRRKHTLTRLLEEKKQQLWEQFLNQSTYFSFDIETSHEEIETEIGSGYTLSTFELAMIDDIFAWAERTYKVNPNEVFDSLQLHSVIRKASEGLFKDGHYAQAIFDACKALINYVKRESGEKLIDGTDLMGKVFSIKWNERTNQITRKPVLQLNKLRSREDIDEQMGFMHLFMGSVLGIRNPKAHAEIEQKDPFKALEYLAFLSLLAKRTQEATRCRKRK
ncbi:MAG: TIGR02391 family protein [Candidatus Bathyarchaeia archaeon]